MRSKFIELAELKMAMSSSTSDSDSSSDAHSGIKLGSPFKEGPLLHEIKLADPFPFPILSEPAPKRKKVDSESSELQEDSNSSVSSKSASASYSEESDTSVEYDSQSSSPLSDSSYDFGLQDCFSDDHLTSADDTSDKLFDSSHISLFQTIAVLVSWFTSYPSISKEAFSRLLYVLKNYILPQPNNLPTSYQKAFSLIKSQVVPLQDFHCCVNDCIIYRSCTEGDYSSMSVCPVCGEDRYQPYSKIPRKRYKYIPLAPRIRRMFNSETTSKLLQDHQNAKTSSNISDLHQTQVWKANYSPSGMFQGDPRGLSLALCTDGMNPFAKQKVVYSMWPVTVSVLNFPHQYRTSAVSMLMVGIIPGREEAKSLKPYLDLLVEELNRINGIEMYDGYQCQTFSLKAAVQFSVLDYPGQNKVFQCHGAGAYAGCVYCEHKGEYSTFLDKMVYPGNRAFLATDSSYRVSKSTFPSGSEEHKEKPKLKTMAYLEAALKKLDEATTRGAKQQAIRDTGCKGRFSMLSMPSHNRYDDVPVDPMHLIKNIVEHIVKLINGDNDSVKVRNQEKQLKRFSSAWIKEGERKLPKASFVLTKEEISLANDRLKQIRVPSGFDWNNHPFFSKPSVMKSHQWKQVAVHGVLKYSLRGFLGKNQQRTLIKLWGVLARLCSEKVNKELVDSLKVDVTEVLVLIERDFPLSLQVIVFHLLHHLPYFIDRFGPVYNFWMYPYERFNSWVTRRVLNRRFPESTVVETYRLAEWANYMELSGQLDYGATSANEEHTIANLSEQFTLAQDQLAEIKMAYSNMDECSYGHDPDLPVSAYKLKSKHYFTETGRKVTVNSADGDSETSYVSNSHVSSLVEGVTLIGRILTLFVHTRNSGVSTDFAYVSWFDGPYLDKSCDLHYVYSTSCKETVVLLSSLSTPYVTALDEQEPCKLWILNFF